MAAQQLTKRVPFALQNGIFYVAKRAVSRCKTVRLATSFDMYGNAVNIYRNHRTAFGLSESAIPHPNVITLAIKTDAIARSTIANGL